MGDVSPRLLEYQARAKRQHWHGKGYVTSLAAAHHPDDLSFARQQSSKMREAEWERRISAPRPIWKDLVAGAFLMVFIYVCLVVL